MVWAWAHPVRAPVGPLTVEEDERQHTHQVGGPAVLHERGRDVKNPPPTFTPPTPFSACFTAQELNFRCTADAQK